MANLNLGVFLDETFDIQLDIEGKDILKIRKPDKGLELKIAALQVQNHKTTQDYMESLDKLVLYILNWNIEGSDQTQRANTLPMDAKIALLKGYTEFMVGIKNDPN